MSNSKLAIEHHIIEQALGILSERTGINGEWQPNPGKIGLDGHLVVSLQKEKITFQVEVKKTLRQQQLPDIFARAARNQPFMLIADELFPKLKAQLREKQIAYLDGAGNFFMSVNGHYVWIDGHKVSKKRSPVGKAFTKAGLKLIFHLLIQEDLLRSSHREIAARSGVSLGLIGLVLNALKELGFLLVLNKKELTLNNKRLLLDKWTDGYQQLLKPSLFMGAFDFGEKMTRDHWHDLPLLSGDTWGNEAAAELLTNHLNAEKLTLYTGHSRAAVMKEWKLVPAQTGTLHVFRKFWGTSDDNVIVLPLLTFADLVAMDDPRCDEAAEIIYNTHLKSIFDEQNRSQRPVRYTRKSF